MSVALKSLIQCLSTEVNSTGSVTDVLPFH